MYFITGNRSNLSKTEYTNIGKYRYRVFVETLGWQLDCIDKIEFDQFDQDYTEYVIAKNDENEIIGIARLLPTIYPYLLGEIFPELLNGLPIPSSDKIWEISRFAVHDFSDREINKLRGSKENLSVNLLKSAMHHANEKGATHLVSASPISMEKLLIRNNFEWNRLGNPTTIEKYNLFACLLRIKNNNTHEQSPGISRYCLPSASIDINNYLS